MRGRRCLIGGVRNRKCIKDAFEIITMQKAARQTYLIFQALHHLFLVGLFHWITWFRSFTVFVHLWTGAGWHNLLWKSNFGEIPHTKFVVYQSWCVATKVCIATENNKWNSTIVLVLHSNNQVFIVVGIDKQNYVWWRRWLFDDWKISHDTYKQRNCRWMKKRDENARWFVIW